METSLPLPNNYEWMPENLRASRFAKALAMVPDCFLSTLQHEVGGEFDIALGKPTVGYAIKLKFSEPQVGQRVVTVADVEACRMGIKVVMFAQITNVNGEMVFYSEFEGNYSCVAIGSKIPDAEVIDIFMALRNCLSQLADALVREFSSCYRVVVRLPKIGRGASDLQLRVSVDDIDIAFSRSIRLEKGKHVVKIVPEEDESKTTEINFPEMRSLIVTLPAHRKMRK